jgi:fused signal recognition particle receptor
VVASFFNRLKNALSKTSSKIASGIDHILFKKRLDAESLQLLEETLIMADLGVKTSGAIVGELNKRKFDKDITTQEVKEELVQIITDILQHSQKHFDVTPGRLNVILVCGVNGSGKTTTIGKLANFYALQGLKVAIAACDTFRAAAVAQLESWAAEAGANIYKGGHGSDPASVAYKAVEESLQNHTDILFIDTAGRLHNQKNLMDELAKIFKVIQKLDDTAPHHSLLVLDGTTGQNMINQVQEFCAIAKVSGLIVTKLDGTAKAGALVAIVSSCKMPVYFIGAGEALEDLRQFVAYDFAEALVGLKDGRGLN